MTFLRFLMLLSLVAWVGGIIFFAFVLAPTVFRVLPSRELAGSVVNRALPVLHWIGLTAGVIFLGSSMAYEYSTRGEAHPLALRHLLIILMIVLTLVSQVAIGGKMMALRTEMGVIDNVAQDDPRRIEFNRLHHWSTRVEGTVFFLGLAVIWLTARRFS